MPHHEATLSHLIVRHLCSASWGAVILSAMADELAKLADAARAFRRAEATLEKRRMDLADAIVEAAIAGVRQSEIVKITGYTREHVRRIIRHAADAAARPDDPF